MALIHCEECAREVSDRAAACPHCGAPLSAIERGVVTTQATGKAPKIVQLVGLGFIIIGVVSCVGQIGTGNDYKTSVWLNLIGFALWIGGRAAAWWRHG